MFYIMYRKRQNRLNKTVLQEGRDKQRNFEPEHGIASILSILYTPPDPSRLLQIH